MQVDMLKAWLAFFMKADPDALILFQVRSFVRQFPDLCFDAGQIVLIRWLQHGVKAVCDSIEKLAGAVLIYVDNIDV